MQSSVVVFYSHKHVSFFSWVQVACPRLSIDWGYAFPKPLLSPYEVRNPLFYPMKIKLLRTFCCQILAIYSTRDSFPFPRSLWSLLLVYLSLLGREEQEIPWERGWMVTWSLWCQRMFEFVRVNQRSKHFRLVSEQRKTEERDFRFWTSEKWNENQKMKEGGGVLPFFLTPPLLLAPFFARSLTLAPRSLLRNSSETLTTQANVRVCWEVLEDSLWRRASARNVSFLICLWW